MDIWSEFAGPNAAYVEELYERYRRDPQSVDEATRQYFDGFPTRPAAEPAGERGDRGAGAAGGERAVTALVNLANAIRDYGHLAAQLDPLGAAPPGDPALNLDVVRRHRTRSRRVAGPAGRRTCRRAARGTVSTQSGSCATVYSARLGHDYEHVRQPEARAWLREAAESRRFRPPQDPIDPVALLDRLTQIEAFEQFLQKFYPGKTRFSIEGLDTMIPILDEVIAAAAEKGVPSILIGMAHRGRLNVLAHTLNKPYAQILAEFKDPLEGQQWMIREDLGWTGDVKYHKGARRAIQGGEAMQVVVSMVANPSHLEFVNPVVEGMARAAISKVDRPGAASGRRATRVADPHPRRRLLPRTRDRRGDAQPRQYGRLPHRRHGPHHRQQPGRLHRGRRRTPQHPVRQRPGEGFQDSRDPRERRRPGGVRGGGADRVRLRRAFRARLSDRSRRLPALRAQRRRRSNLHAAAHVQGGGRPSERAAAVGRRVAATGPDRRGAGGADDAKPAKRVAGRGRCAAARARRRRRAAAGAAPRRRPPGSDRGTRDPTARVKR